MTQIPSEQITFLIQGPISKLIYKTTANIKEYFPNSKIIISNCSTTEFKPNGIDLILKPDDPGFFYYSKEDGAKVNNINRQIVTTGAGLEHVQTKYCFKLRSDFLITGKNFLKHYNSYPKYEADYRIFKEKLLSCCYFARNPTSRMPFPFHISDLCFFGLTEDIKNLFDIPLMTESEAYWETKGHVYNKYVPEQFLFINCLKKNGKKINCDYHNDVTQSNIIETEKYFASNFVFLEFDQFNLKPSKATFDVKAYTDSFQTCYTHVEWKSLYKKHVDSSIKIPKKDHERNKIESYYKRDQKIRRIANLAAVFCITRKQRKIVRKKFIEKYRASL